MVRFFFLWVCASLSACTAVTTQLYNPADVARSNDQGIADSSLQRFGGTDGVIYFLPRRDIRIEFERKLYDVKELDDQISQAKKTLKSKQQELISANALATNFRKRLEATENDDVIPDLKEKIAKAEEKRSTKRREVAKAKSQLETLQGFRLAAIADPENECPIVQNTFKVTELPMVPDTSVAFRANLNHSAFRDDKLKLVVNERGLLSSADSIGVDKTAVVVTDLARVIISTATGVAPAPNKQQFEVSAAPAQEDGCEKLYPIKSAMVFDPHDWTNKEQSQLASALGVEDLAFKMQVKKPETFPGFEFEDEAISANLKYEHEKSFTRGAHGLLYRQPVPYVITITRVDQEQRSYVQTAYAGIHMLPNGGPIGIAPVRAGIGTRSQTLVSFDDGMLTSYDVDRPSEMAQIVRIPLDITTTLISALSELIPFAGRDFDAELKEAEIAKAMADVAYREAETAALVAGFNQATSDIDETAGDDL